VLEIDEEEVVKGGKEVVFFQMFKAEAENEVDSERDR
jgi:hypothetical protein